jgi:hypothetical protein
MTRVITVAALTVALLAPTPAQAHGSTSWDRLAHCESTHRWRLNSGNGHFGGLQFTKRTWLEYGGWKRNGGSRFAYWPHRATRRQQITVAKRVAYTGWAHHRAQGGSNAWPSCWWRSR